MPPLMTPDYTAVLLAGGRSVRMGRDKARLEWEGRPLWEFQALKLKRLNPLRLLISARFEQGLNEVGQAEYPDMEWLFDPPEDDLGPMGVILRVLKLVSMPVLVLAVDMPFMESAFLSELGAKAVTKRGFFFEGAHGVEPLCGVYHPSMLNMLEACVQTRRLSLQKLIREAAVHDLATISALDVNSAKFFENLNTLDSWAGSKAV